MSKPCPPINATLICAHFNRGHCKFGDGCKQIHLSKTGSERIRRVLRARPVFINTMCVADCISGCPHGTNCERLHLSDDVRYTTQPRKISLKRSRYDNNSDLPTAKRSKRDSDTSNYMDNLALQKKCCTLQIAKVEMEEKKTKADATVKDLTAKLATVNNEVYNMANAIQELSADLHNRTKALDAMHVANASLGIDYHSLKDQYARLAKCYDGVTKLHTEHMATTNRFVKSNKLYDDHDKPLD
jgi:hypothetical protein